MPGRSSPLPDPPRCLRRPGRNPPTSRRRPATGNSCSGKAPSPTNSAAQPLFSYNRGVMPTLTRVILSKPRGFCAGVERAIEVVEQALKLFPAPVYVRKEIVHNPHVVSALRQKGAVFVDELTEVPPGSTTIFSAHGVSPAVNQAAAQRALNVIDATCPLVTKVHVEAKRFARNGYTLLLIGHAGHEEVAGTMGEGPRASQLGQTD